MAHRIIVIGAANADISGIPSANLIPRDSNPGKISITRGGVGANIAVELRNFGNEVSFITVFGGDTFAQFVRTELEDSGVDIFPSLNCRDKNSSVYVYITDGEGDTYAAVNDMDIINEITPSFLRRRIDAINDYDACVIDCNLSREAIEFLAENVTVPLYADPTSGIKAVKLKGLLDRFTAIKPNRMEAEAIGDIPCRCYLSSGLDGIYAKDGDREVHAAAPNVKVTDSNGCGDAATAAIIHAELEGYNLKQTAEFAVKTAFEKAAGN